MPQAFTCGTPLYHSRRQRKLQLDVSSVIPAACKGRARATHRFPPAGERRSEIRRPAVLESRTDLERVAGVAAQPAALSDQLCADARWVRPGVAEGYGCATSRPYVVAAEVVVRQQ